MKALGDKIRQFVVFAVVWLVVTIGVRIFLDVVIDGLAMADIDMVRLLWTSAVGAVVAGAGYVFVYHLLSKKK